MSSLFFANPLGFGALLGIPVVLLIHYLQQPAKKEVISTLFLLENLSPESLKGNVIERLRSSWPLWLQLLAVFIMTWLLTEPRWVQSRKETTVVIILDSSASMWTFRDKVREEVQRVSQNLEAVSSVVHWVLMSSVQEQGYLYRGDERAELLQAVESWEPTWGRHDFSHAFETAHQRKGEQGLVLFLTDHKGVLPDGVFGIGVGRSIDQVGFVGAKVSRPNGPVEWRAIVKNWSDQATKRKWWIEREGVKTSEAVIELEANQGKVLGGTLDSSFGDVELVLQGDAFTLDDRMPILEPLSKRLKVFVGPKGRVKRTMEKFVERLGNLEIVANESESDVVIATSLTGYVLGSEDRQQKPRIIFRTPRDEAGSREVEPIIQEVHLFTEGVSWQGLLSSGPMGFMAERQDEVLLWQSKQPLVFIGEQDGEMQLMINFDFEHSNADRLPAFLVLLHRFFNEVAKTRLLYHQKLVKTHEVVELHEANEGDSVVLRMKRGNEVREKSFEGKGSYGYVSMSGKPGVALVKVEGEDLFKAAVHFEDSFEADLRNAKSFSNFEEELSALRKEGSDPDPYREWWILLLLLLLGVSWKLQPWSLSSGYKDGEGLST